MKKAFGLLLVFALLLSMAACARPAVDKETVAPTGAVPHTVSIHSAGGMALSDVQVYVYTDDTLKDLSAYGQTDEQGELSLELAPSDNYAITLSGVPDGYRIGEIYRFTDTNAQITLNSALIMDESLSAAQLGVGDVMYDFTVALPDGTQLTLSEVLAEKKMVLLNFFFTTCGPCANEFPFMQEAYDQFSDSVGIIALDPLEENQAVANYQASMGLSFPMAACPAAWSQTFNISGYPTSVVVDRYGVICLVEVGGITSLRPFTAVFEHFTAEPYEQKLLSSIGELVTNVKPTCTMPAAEEIAAVLGSDPYGVAYRPEEDPEDAEYAWPFVIDEKNGEVCIKASNQGIEASYAILYADVPLKAGQAVGFDYLSSTEKGCDILYVIVNDQDVLAISGYDEEENWKTCYPWVAQTDGTYEVALCYLKDGDTSEKDDTVYLKNLRVVDAARIDTPTYIPRQAAIPGEGTDYDYVDIVLNEKDGYYHVGTADGPLLMADLMNYTQYNEEKTIWELCYNEVVTRNGKGIYDDMVNYFSYASNSRNSGVCTVNEELAQWLILVDDCTGFDLEDDKEWLKACKYYEAFGTETQLADPIAGLASFSAYEAKLGKNVDTNCFYYDRPIMPRGLLARFTPEKSGVYLISSRCDSDHGVEGWIFGEDRSAEHYTYEPDIRTVPDTYNVYMYYYMEAGQNYYIDIAFWDISEVNTVYYDIEYIAQSIDVFRAASPGFFTYDTNATGDQMYALIAGGIDVVLGDDGYYYEDLGDGKKGSMLYADFTGITGVFSNPITSVPAYHDDGTVQKDTNGNPVMIKGMIELGGFDFSKTENDLYILGILEKHDGDVEKAKAYLKALWGEDYDTYAEQYQLSDVLSGRYHGRGEDYTSIIESYLDDMITTGPAERHGCVPVTEELAEILQLLMDKYTFQNVDHSWTKLCYYYDRVGP